MRYLVALGFHFKTVRSYHFAKVLAYTFVLLALQVHWISRLPAQALRVDLFVPLVFAVALIWPPMGCLLWAFFWGFVMDLLSGKFWGFHVGSYVATCCLVMITMDRLELGNPLFHLLFIGLVSFGQSVILGLFLSFEPGDPILSSEIWGSLLGRSLFMTFSAAFIVYPLKKITGH